MSAHSKNKGSSFERKVAKILSKRFEHRSNVISSFRRSADSGSYFGGLNRARLATHDVTLATFGDIVTPRGFRFTIEAKHYASAPSYNQVITQQCAMFDDWIAQAEADSISAGKPPLIIIKFDRVPETVLVKGVPSPVSYHGYSILPLTDLLELPDESFFA